MTFEVGKTYPTRGGDRVSITKITADSERPLRGIVERLDAFGGPSDFLWHADGFFCSEGKHPLDLVPPQPTAEDAPKYGPWIAFNGMERPADLDDDAMVQVCLRCETIENAENAGGALKYWNWGEDRRHSTAISNYRVLLEPKLRTEVHEMTLAQIGQHPPIFSTETHGDAWTVIEHTTHFEDDRPVRGEWVAK